jgi:ferredoxin
VPTVIIEREDGGQVTLEAPPGARLIGVCDDAGAEVPFGCRSATCGTCRVDVLEGIELLEQAETDERDVLAFFRDPPTRRLACSARIGNNDGRIRLRAV